MPAVFKNEIIHNNKVLINEESEVINDSNSNRFNIAIWSRSRIDD